MAIPGCLANPGRRDRRPGVAELKSWSAWPLLPSTLYQAAHGGLVTGVCDGLYSIPCGALFRGTGYRGGGGNASKVPRPRSSLPNQRLHLTPLVGAVANGPEARCKGRGR
jgi:hypothetical protein